MIYKLGRKTPTLHAGAYIHESAVIIGAVTLEEGASVWCHATLRADNEPIMIGKRSNIQDGAVLHTDPGMPLHIEQGVSVGHLAMLHGCTIGENSLIGIKSVILNGANIGRNCLIGANTLITEGKIIPDGSLVIGSPGKVVRSLTEQEISALKENATSYVNRSLLYQVELEKIG
ncbi:MAG: gamma carbonic anhydrase family protein [Ferrovum sp. 37-45-19]|jgi:carbonic anhydrase/acetyltransferase-like protein (isoleucine patch superfamily)|uniref:gamma carbonic anhydrase family protein n=1 Tax=Ferrovum sp. JA12 TaxID=1356299 RepID=UPI000702A4E6|nr:gamma carbonic anhydrase family protein [Ferrovum sp. JA12]OYV80514.1 MAG: gamma carbonic anhydrase family protein [Ferrovum sp. 21-44-67]OYV94829.1 MAG: gamma carbonic anhydrase family protein [Ferrovum sp. 37-45-19]OZB34138.1 MAG: gamma carbonic anhydrase family protein [Ferrovum sp. 34-44-207]HQT81041.1 gamma carbonic anhydrase family protein [Ferrovaceae bacterium]KRH79234.1 2,3,4,5-tetrahydropyridine-2,6-dicarboxylate N-acetyltransferase [Ferrovum sp. JA12]